MQKLETALAMLAITLLLGLGPPLLGQSECFRFEFFTDDKDVAVVRTSVPFVSWEAKTPFRLSSLSSQPIALVQAVAKIRGVDGVEVFNDLLIIAKGRKVSWTRIRREIKAVVEFHFYASHGPIAESQSKKHGHF